MALRHSHDKPKKFFFVWEDYFCEHIERILVLCTSAERPLNEEKHYQWYHIYFFFSWCFNSIVITSMIITLMHVLDSTTQTPDTVERRKLAIVQEVLYGQDKVYEEEDNL